MRGRFDFSPHALLLLVLAIFFASLSTGCATPQADYVNADAEAWKPYDKDGRLEVWIGWGVERWKTTEAAIKAWEAGTGDRDKKPSHVAGEIPPDVADALGQLNVGRRARVSHALVQVKPQ